MTKYSPEPSRKHLILHLTFDDIGELGDPQDLSPQANSPASTDLEIVPGRVGVGAQATTSSAQIGPVTLGTHSAFSVAFWIRPEWLDRDPNVNEYKQLAASDEGHIIVLEESGEINFRVPGVDTTPFLSNTTVPVDEWTHVECVYDGSDRFIYLNGKEDAVGAVSSPGTDATLGDVTFLAKDSIDTSMDDLRVYRTGHEADTVTDLYEIGAFHQQIDNLGEAWDNPGIPYRVGASNANLAGTLGEAHDANFRHLDSVRDAIHIDSASGLDLDRIGRSHGILRPTGESDPVYRARIKAVLASGRSRGTFDDLLEATSVVVETTEDRIFIDAEDVEPATAFIYVRTSDLEDANLTSGDITSILQDAVPGGHDINVVEQGANPFTLIADGDVNDEDLALTSDSIATGGGLVSDA